MTEGLSVEVAMGLMNYLRQEGEKNVKLAPLVKTNTHDLKVAGSSIICMIL